MIESWMMVRVQAALDRLEQNYPAIDGRVRLSSGDYGPEILAFAGHLSVVLNETLWTPDIIASHEAEWDGLVVDSSLEGIITHEFGHALFRSAERLIGFDEANALAMAYAEVDHWFGPIDVRRACSPFGQENVSECIAESFSAVALGRSAAGTFSAEASMNAITFWEDLLKRMDRSLSPAPAM